MELDLANFRCPDCLYSTTVKAVDKKTAKCSHCEFDLGSYYFTGRSEQEADLFVAAENVRLKKGKQRQDRVGKSEGHTAPIIQPNQSILTTALGYFIAVIIFFIVAAGYHYVQMRDLIQKTVTELLEDNNINGFTTDGINLPLSAVVGGYYDARVFLKSDNGETYITNVVVTSKAVPIVSLFVDAEFFVEIPGEEVAKLMLADM